MQSPFHRFQRSIEDRIQQQFQAICDKKLRIQALVGDRFANEEKFREFLELYNSITKKYETRRETLYRQVKEIERRLRQIEEAEVDEFWRLYLDDQHSPEQDETSTEVSQFNDMSSYDSEQMPDTFNLDALSDVAFTQQTFGMSGEIGESIVQPKRLVARPFRWIYHLRNSQEFTEFFRIRSRLLSEIVNDTNSDEVDIFLRMPFEEKDIELWSQPIPRNANWRDVSSGMAIESDENPSDQLYRFELWNELLNEALRRAENIAATPFHEIYPKFLEWKQSDQKDMVIYLQDMETEIAAQKLVEIRNLEAQLDHLTKELDRRQSGD